MKAPYIAKWSACTRCPLHENARQHVVMRGSIPAEVLFVGEAPGKTENKLGRPFVGRSGTVLNSMLDDVGLTTNYCITNIICCIPWGINRNWGRGEDVVRKPTRAEADACLPHLHELLDLCAPKLVIALGSEAVRYLPAKAVHNALGSHVEYLHLLHPAYILRKGGIVSLEYKRDRRKLHKALSSLGLIKSTRSESMPEVPYSQVN